jgi:hypothetical protein
MAKSRTDLVERALKNLGVLPSGMTPNVQEYNSIDELIDPMIEDLIARDIFFVEDADAIDDKAFLALGNILAGVAAAEFGLQDDAAIAARAQRGEQDLNEIDQRTIRYNHMRYPVLRTVAVTT